MGKLLDRIRARKRRQERTRAREEWEERLNKAMRKWWHEGPRDIKDIQLNAPMWIPILAMVPEDGQIVLVWHDVCGIDIMVCHYNDEDEREDFGLYTFVSRFGFFGCESCLMWMPLPQFVTKALLEGKRMVMSTSEGELND